LGQALGRHQIGGKGGLAFRGERSHT
jgi:hypothetical protein